METEKYLNMAMLGAIDPGDVAVIFALKYEAEDLKAKFDLCFGFQFLKFKILSD